MTWGFRKFRKTILGETDNNQEDVAQKLERFTKKYLGTEGPTGRRPKVARVRENCLGTMDYMVQEYEAYQNPDKPDEVTIDLAVSIGEECYWTALRIEFLAAGERWNQDYLKAFHNLQSRLTGLQERLTFLEELGEGCELNDVTYWFEEPRTVAEYCVQKPYVKLDEPTKGEKLVELAHVINEEYGVNPLDTWDRDFELHNPILMDYENNPFAEAALRNFDPNVLN